MNPSSQPVPDVLALPLAEATQKLVQAGLEVVEVQETRGPKAKEDEGLELRVARILVTGAKAQLVVVRTRPEPVRRGAP
ncbi:MAG: hypothetical protein PWQ86_732 [Bacillota bacterium]|jgi:hypothetical protein|nr:hypothetical protein [Bacillota bacterium]MDK2855519.1 hypothetical protein [Bacillota bacterium]